MTPTRYAFIKANWHSEIVDQALVGFQDVIPAEAVVSGLMQAGLETDVPILSVSLTPHHFQETEHHIGIYRDHFVTKGREAGNAALSFKS